MQVAQPRFSLESYQILDTYQIYFIIIATAIDVFILETVSSLGWHSAFCVVEDDLKPLRVLLPFPSQKKKMMTILCMWVWCACMCVFSCECTCIFICMCVKN